MGLWKNPLFDSLCGTTGYKKFFKGFFYIRDHLNRQYIDDEISSHPIG
jgi:hypothetical protein